MLSSKSDVPNFACSVISGNAKTFFNELEELEVSGISSLHFDMMDGLFVPRFGLYPEYLKEIRKYSALPIDVHMMLTNPHVVVEELISAGATTITSHIEPLTHVHRFTSLIKSFGCKVGLAVNPGTPIQFLEPLIEELDSITLMAINPGIVGHKFIPTSLKKIELTRKLVSESGKTVEIIVDGGVTHANAYDIYAAGADTLICGAGTVFKKPGTISENMNELMETFQN